MLENSTDSFLNQNGFDPFILQKLILISSVSCTFAQCGTVRV